MRWISGLCALLLVIGSARATTVRDLCRIRGQGVSELQGLGLVVGLPGTGDSAKDLVVARPLAAVLANNGLPIANFDELKNSRSIALVMVSCLTRPEGTQVDDRLDVIVSVINSASSLRGGQLYLTPMTGPFPGSDVYAIASGPINLDDPTIPTRGRVRLGVKMRLPIPGPSIGTTFDLIVEPSFAGHQSARHIASRIRDEYLLRPQRLGTSIRPIATAIDDRTIRIVLPENRRSSPVEFVADVLATDIDVAQLKLPARVIVNRASGVFILTQEVEVSLVAISHKNLLIRRITPEPEPTPAAPLVQTERVVGVGTRARPSDRARLDDLLAAFKQLSVPVDDQIQIIEMLHKSGRLHAELVID